MLGARLNRLQRFVYSHHFVGGLRRGAGVLVAFLLVSVFASDPSDGLIAGLGALCVALIDQPGPVKARLREMLGGLTLGVAAVGITGLASQNPLVLLVAVVAQGFFFSLFAVYGKRGSVIGMACLVLTVVTMHTSFTPSGGFFPRLNLCQWRGHLYRGELVEQPSATSTRRRTGAFGGALCHR